MKRLFFLFVLLFGILTITKAQDISKNALGLRLGNNNGLGTEISYQKALQGSNRLELDLGWRNSNHYNAYNLTGIYQWIWEIDNHFYWYTGAGAGFGSWNYNYNDEKQSGTFVYIAGDIAIEYNFDFPIQISLDFRPEFGGNGYFSNNYGSDIAISVRYKF